MDYAIVPRDVVVDEGRAAHGEGRPFGACPYLPETDHAKAWREGFMGALINAGCVTASRITHRRSQ